MTAAGSASVRRSLHTPAVSARLQAIAVEMSYTIKRTSRSLYVKDGEDFCASVAGLDGLLLAAPDSVGSTLLTIVDVSATLEAVGPLKPGDVVITNDAHTSKGLSTHLPDIHVVAPYFHEGEIVAYGWAFIHCSDIGGRVPSSVSPFNRTVYEEGLQIPPTLLSDGGALNEPLLDLIRLNTRTAEANVSDIRAMLAGIRAGERQIAELVARYGADEFAAVQRDLQRGAAEHARALFRTLPAGTYRFSDFLDDDGVSRHPVRFAVTTRIEESGDVVVDFRGTDPQVPSAYNIVSHGRPHAMVTGRVRSVLQTLDPATPVHGGHTGAITVAAPAGSVVNAAYPAAMGVRHGSAVRVSDAVGGCFAQAAPRVMPAAGSGVVIPIVVSEQHEHGRSSQVLTRIFGGFGGAYGLDGHDGKDNSYSNLASSPMESSESELRVRVIDYSLRPDSGGAGRWRGGMGRQLTFEILADGTQVLGRGLERFTFRPWGVAGGQPGEKMRLVLNEGTERERELGKIDVLSVDRGDTVTFRSPGGGGWGDPFLRDAAAVLADVRAGLVSVEAAREAYGVCIAEDAHGLVVAAEATDAARAARPLVHDEEAHAFAFGPERDAWDDVFPEAWYDRFESVLFAAPADARQRLRTGLFDEVLAALPERFPNDQGDGRARTLARRHAEALLVALERGGT
ncbi:hydantoinase B/oxoprolinase family protein [Microbacterium betulae]|uniref:Hydantoinase B/oxoprolinase family protein n=1 Tax=Microbacterium betulae TaxID=2981139 RepID=A0AA97I7H7_9MICO|nr:hydantoinase B/oxoprolinase family protein [Microbacterium sp. AB]WOF23445.1 hydantoinase B/oxoprolinase family protein [Microbacterium sp. AB]